MSSGLDKWNSPAWPFQTKPDARYDLGLIAGGEGVALMPGAGTVYYVDGGSSGPTDNSNDGLTADTPKQTLTAAMALVTDGARDVIVVLNYGSNGRAAEPSWPIVIVKSQFTWIGTGQDTNKWPLITATGSNLSAFELQNAGDRVNFVNLNIGGTGTAAGILITAAAGAWGCEVVNCHFGYEGSVGTNGIRVDSGADAPYLNVRNSHFGAALTGDSILIAGNSTRGWIGRPGNGNTFKPASAQLAINVSGGAVLEGIVDNLIFMSADTEGIGITMSASSSGTMICGNISNDAGADKSSNNPYLDSGTANAWFGNMWADVFTDPA